MITTLRTLVMVNNAQQAEILRTVKVIQNSVPPQVLLQQPFVFTDALNRRAPVHLEWINSWDAFIAVLKVRFRDAGSKKIDNREFALSCSRLNRDITWNQSWESAFLPGREYGMSMVFQQATSDTTLCVSCRQPCDDVPDQDTTW